MEAAEPSIHFLRPLPADDPTCGDRDGQATIKPITGERKMKRTGLVQPLRMSALKPALATAAPP